MAEHPASRSPGFRPSPPEGPTPSAPTSDARPRPRHDARPTRPEPAPATSTAGSCSRPRRPRCGERSPTPTELAAWWGEGSELDATPGGEGRLVEDDEPTRLARVVEVRPERRLVLDLWPEDPESDDPATRVTIELTPCPFGTVLTVFECVLLDLSELPVLAAPHAAVHPPPLEPALRRADARPGVSAHPRAPRRGRGRARRARRPDPSRRAAGRRRAGPLTATELAAPAGISRQAMSKHLGLLEQAGLVHGERVGRETRYEIVPGSLDPAAAWLDRVGTAWDARLGRLRRHLADG